MSSDKTNDLPLQGRKPNGFTGYIIGKAMNVFHSKSYKLGLSKIPKVDNSICLDIGCGGGKLVKLLALQKHNAKVYGLDHSYQMVNLSTKVNKSFIKDGVVEIIQGSVSKLPFPDTHFDLITAFESIQFWPDLDLSLNEVRKKLKPSGIFLIVNMIPKEDSKWFDIVQIKSVEEYMSRLKIAGFSNISIDIESKNGWGLFLAH